jgi:hypothetical protein
MNISQRKWGVAIALVVLLLSVAVAALAAERKAILDFYEREEGRTCSGNGSAGAAGADLKRHAASNFYVGHLIDSGMGSHVSRRIAYHRLMADFVMARLIAASKVDELFQKTPCGFRRP